jgi:hypothetical protein
MARLLNTQEIGGRTRRIWSHYGDQNQRQLTVEVVEDFSKAMRKVKQSKQLENSKSSFRVKADLPMTLLDEAAKISAKTWGVSSKEAFSELMSQKSDRGKKVLKLLTEGRDFRKFQAKHYA